MHQYNPKITKILIYIMNPCFFIIFSLVLLNLDTTTASQLVDVVGGGGGGDHDHNVIMNKCLDKERLALLN